MHQKVVGRGLPRLVCIKNEREDNKMELCREIIEELQKQIISFKEEGFYDTFEYTVTGKNETHPRTIGILCKILWNIKTVSSVYVDMRFNEDGGEKFQPDLTGFDSYKNSIIFIDYESPNSSDARVLEKDINSYKSWVTAKKSQVPYIIITTLPDKYTPEWQVRYTSKNGCNYGYGDKKREIRENPFRFWYLYYRKYMKGKDTRNIFFANINGKSVNLIKM
jgi:hypothetical protein